MGSSLRCGPVAATTGGAAAVANSDLSKCKASGAQRHRWRGSAEIVKADAISLNVGAGSWMPHSKFLAIRSLWLSVAVENTRF